ncbi:MAG: beta-ketoacyl-[acyl-carrier-protein] synthase family protein [Candidatus Omnitrophota bacterium]|nr:beta-ketoacyl-[acyl-carrier-protein] synthase family protein [Candidatus Omnitrophota bacterium]
MGDIVITGMGIVSPAGIGKANFWRHIREGRSFVSPITRFDSSLYPSRVAGQIKEIEPYSNSFSPRMLKKIDLFSHLALIASELALKDADINLENFDLKRTGIFMGNAIGGWLFAETELRDLYLEGWKGVSPFMASAWFPAAPQGQISIHYGIKGYSKTLIADRAGSLMAINYAAKTLKRKKLDLVLVGGMEAPVTPYALLCCSTYGFLSKKNGGPGAYSPFDKERDGFVIAEGSGILTLERSDDAEKRQAPRYAKVCGFYTNCDAYDRIKPDPEGLYLAKALEETLKQAGFDKSSVDYICADGAATIWGDISETKAIKKVFGKRAKHIPVSAPKSMFGNMLGAQGSVDVITTVLSMMYHTVPPTINYRNPDPACDLDYVPNKSEHKEVKRALVISRGRGGINAVMALEKVESRE